MGVKAEREKLLSDLHPVFRQLDAAVALYIDLVCEFPDSTDEKLQGELISQDVEEPTAFGCVSFVPLAFGRLFVEELEVAVADTYIEHDLSTDQKIEKPLSEALEFIWAKQVAPIYREDPNYSNAFKAIVLRSPEVDAVNNALNAGCPEEELKKSHMGPVVVFVGEPKKRWWQFWRK